MRRIVLSITAILFIAMSWSGVLDRFAQPLAEQGFQRALVAFGVARGLNGVISVVQNTEVAVEPAGVGVVVGAGQILDPINDLVERFSWLMLASSALLGLQMLLSGILANPAVNVAVTLVFSLLLLSQWCSRLPRRWGRFAAELALILITTRFLFPVIALGESSVYDAFLEERSTQSLDYLKQATEQLGESADVPEAVDTDSPWWDRMTRLYHSAGKGLDLRARLKQYEAAVSDASENIIHLVVSFLLETVIVPLLLVSLAVAVIRASVRRLAAREDSW